MDRPLRRGDLVLVREPGTATGKARPCVVVQRDAVLDAATKITACPLTSVLHGPAGQRPFVAPTDENGLRAPSEVQVDWISSFSLRHVGGTIGRLDAPTMQKVDEALRRWLDL